MILAWRALFTLVLLFVVATNAFLNHDEDEIYSNSWAVEVEGGIEAAQKIAEKHGFVHVGKLDHLPVHHFVHPSSPSHSTQRLHSKHADLLKEDGVVHVEQQRVRRRVKRTSYTLPIDPRWFNQWYLHRPGHDMNVNSVWQQGITGKGIVVSILDDGLEHTHPDLKNNYDPLASYDFNSHDSDPIPRYDYSNENKHGTRCAGEVAAAKNNICSVGVAYGARIGGVRMLDGTVTDIVEASSLSFNSQYIDIYSSSWGPNDDGVTVDGPARLAKHAFVHGVTEGRGGRGSIYMWASGNGGTKDNCNCDGYAVSPYTISVGSASEHNDFPWYAEFCSSTLAVTYSSGSSGEKQIVSTDLRHGCTQRHTGTSASAPMAAGLLALALEVNSNLTWRDAQYLVVYSSNPDIPKGDDWFTNGAGLRVSHRYGYGMMDAAAIVNRARHWINVPARQTCNISIALPPSLHTATNNRPVQVDVTIDDSTCNSIKYLEHVQVVSTINVATGRRGDISLSVRSPHGTLSHLLKPRYLDRARKNIEKWPFMTIQSWGENPMGKWEITLKARGMTAASLKQATLVLYGVSEVPASVSAIPSKCHDECAKNCSRPGAKYCDSCKHVRLASTLECVSVCPPGTYKDYSMCRPCSTNCSSCTHTSCLSCQPGSILLPDRTCSYSCPVYSYNTANKTCAPCHPSCLSCSGPGSTDCTACGSQQYKLIKGMCKLNTSCDSHSYYDHRAFECRQCHPSCAECRGREAVDCLSCYAGRIHVKGHCVQDPLTKMSCHSGQYYNEESSNCSMCPTGCGNCSDDITCTQCLAGYFLQPRAVGDTSEETVLCHSSCTSGYYADASTHRCMPCPTSCVSCSGPSSCLSCVEGHPVDGGCTQPCAAMEYYNITSRKCLPCSPSCSACRDGATCTSCSGQLFLTSDGQCISTCPNHTVIDQTSRRCESIRCHPSCSTCRGVEPSDCLSCSYPRKFHQNTCLEQCPMNTYPAQHSCKPCHSSCATCGGPLESDCDSCPHNTYFNHYHCLESCPRGSFPTEGRCLACIADCDECADVRSCKQCSAGLVYSPNEMLCKSSCPSGLFNNNGVCRQCHASCATCQSSASHCTSCSSGHALQSEQGVCLRCCSKEVSSICCNCSSSTNQCVYVGSPVSFYTHTPSSLPDDSGVTSPSSFHSQPLVAVLIVTVIVILVTVVIVVVVLVYRRRHSTLLVARSYRAMEPAHDGLNIAVIEDDEFDTESENEIFINHKP